MFYTTADIDLFEAFAGYRLYWKIHLYQSKDVCKYWWFNK